MRGHLSRGVGGALTLLIMVIGSFVLWVGTPLVWLWVGSQIQGATASLSTALAAMFIGVIVTVTVLGALLAKLSNSLRHQALARGRGDPGHGVLESVLVISAVLTIVVFAVWFLFFAGAEPIPFGISL